MRVSIWTKAGKTDDGRWAGRPASVQRPWVLLRCCDLVCVCAGSGAANAASIAIPEGERDGPFLRCRRESLSSK